MGRSIRELLCPFRLPSRWAQELLVDSPAMAVRPVELESLGDFAGRQMILRSRNSQIPRVR